MSKTTVAEGRFSVTVTTPDNKTEKWDNTSRKVEIVDGKTIVTREPGTDWEKITVLPEGSTVTINK